MELKISEISADIPLSGVIRFLGAFLKIKPELKNSFIIQLPIEITVAELCQPGQALEQSAEAARTKPDNPYSFSKKDSPSPSSINKPADTVARAVLKNLDKNEIKAKWNEVLARVKQKNHSLSFILRVCRPKDLNGNQLCLAFKYKFHKDRIGDASIKALIEETLKEVYGQVLLIEAVVEEEISAVREQPANGSDPSQTDKEPSLSPDAAKANIQADGEDGNIMDNLLKNFGGKVVG